MPSTFLSAVGSRICAARQAFCEPDTSEWHQLVSLKKLALRIDFPPAPHFDNVFGGVQDFLELFGQAALRCILAGTLGITPAMELRLGKFCGNGPELWLNLQQSHDLWHARQNLAEEFALILTAKAP